MNFKSPKTLAFFQVLIFFLAGLCIFVGVLSRALSSAAIVSISLGTVAVIAALGSGSRVHNSNKAAREGK
jgi:uncharacterized membrane protein YphA (DoxX/SURF4 family)